MSPKWHRRAFSAWFGIVLPPIYLGGLIIGFVLHWWLGALMMLLAGLWFYDMGETTCSRCGSYGTLNCGVQGKAVSWFWKRRDPRAVSRLRVRLHLAFDGLMIALFCGVYVWWDWRWAVPALVWTAGAVVLVYGPKRHHGLLPLLKAPEKPRGLVSLPVLVSDGERGGSCGAGCG